MRRTSLVIGLLFLATALSAERFMAAPGSMIRIEGTSTLKAWTMEGDTVNGQLTLDPAVTKPLTPATWRSVGDRAAAVAVTIPVASIRSGDDRLDRLMSEALKAKTNPVIRYDMTSSALLEATGPTLMMKTTGNLTIAGVTRPISMDVAGTRTSDGRYVLAGRVPVRMSEFGIKPPTVMKSVTAADEVKVTFRWVIAPRKAN